MPTQTKALLLEQVRKYHREHETRQFLPGVTPILSSGAVLDEDDRTALVEAALELRIASSRAPSPNSSGCARHTWSTRAPRPTCSPSPR
jgi:NDP-hexose-3,4-dehydratase